MSDSSGELWSSNPNAPRIPPWLYVLEKENFAGSIVGAILYGIVVALFFQCIGALMDPANNMKKRVKWGLIAHTVALFSVATISAVERQDIVFTAFINLRNFPGTEDFEPGPVGGINLLDNELGFVILTSFTFPLNQWLSDGLLLYRCYVIYAMNYWAMALPTLIYITSIGVGAVCIYDVIIPDPEPANAYMGVDISYYSICLGLNILLTLMIATKLVLHRRNFQHAMGTSGGTTGVYTTIVVILVESYALYAIALLLYVVPWALQSVGLPVFSKIVGNVQVIAPYLITLRVANRRALTSKMISGSENLGSIQFISQGTTDGDEFLPDRDPTGSAQTIDEAPDNVFAGARDDIEGVPL